LKWPQQTLIQTQSIPLRVPEKTLIIFSFKGNYGIQCGPSHCCILLKSPVEFTFISFVFRYFEVILNTVNGVRVVIPSSYVIIWLYLCKLAYIHYDKFATLGYVKRDFFFSVYLFMCSFWLFTTGLRIILTLKPQVKPRQTWYIKRKIHWPFHIALAGYCEGTIHFFVLFPRDDSSFRSLNVSCSPVSPCVMSLLYECTTTNTILNLGTFEQKQKNVCK